MWSCDPVLGTEFLDSTHHTGEWLSKSTRSVHFSLSLLTMCSLTKWMISSRAVQWLWLHAVETFEGLNILSNHTYLPVVWKWFEISDLIISIWIETSSLTWPVNSETKAKSLYCFYQIVTVSEMPREFPSVIQNRLGQKLIETKINCLNSQLFHEATLFAPDHVTQNDWPQPNIEV